MKHYKLLIKANKMGQKPSKCQSGVPHRKSRKKNNLSKFQNINVDTNNFSDCEKNDDVVFDEHKQERIIIQRCNDVNSEKSLPFQQYEKHEEVNQFFQKIGYQNHNRVRRFRDKLAYKLQRTEMQYILETFLKRGIFNRKEYCGVKNQLNQKWMCWRLAYILEMKIRNDDLEGKTTVYDLFLECLRSHQVRRNKLADRLNQEDDDPSPSWCSDGKDEGILDFADGLVLTPPLLESVLNCVHCSDQLSWWRWIPHELGMQNFNYASTDQESPEFTYESEHSKLKKTLYQWGMTEGFARGGLEILILCFRNHNDACEVNWRGLKKLFRSRRFST